MKQAKKPLPAINVKRVLKSDLIRQSGYLAQMLYDAEYRLQRGESLQPILYKLSLVASLIKKVEDMEYE